MKALVAMHIANREDVNQRANAGNDQHPQTAQTIDLKAPRYVQRARFDPRDAKIGHNLVIGCAFHHKEDDD